MARHLRVGAAALALALGGTVACGCRSETPAPPPVEAGTDALGDGKRLAEKRVEWLARWKRAQPLPACGELVAAAHAERCVAAERAQQALIDAVTKSAADTAQIEAAARLAGTAAAATRALRFASMKKVGREVLLRRPDAGAGRDAGPPARPATSGGHDGHDHAPVAVASDPHLPVIKGYAGATGGALRYLGVFLQHGPLALRGRAFSAIERFAREHPEWGEPRHVVREAALFEKDAELKAKLDAFTRAPPRPRAEDAAATP